MLKIAEQIPEQDVRPKKRILIVDDSADSINLIKECLCEQGGEHLEFIEAHDGKEALDILGHEQIDAVICDEVMPFMSGSNLAKEAQKKSYGAPFLLLSGLDKRDLEKSVSVVENVQLLTKPFDVEVLQQLVNKMIS